MFEPRRHDELELLHSFDADIYLQGAHLTRFRDWLFLSSRSQFARDKSIRGGVPIVFPWFGPNKSDASAPAHGWARTRLWQVGDVAEDAVTLWTQHDNWHLKMKFGIGDELRLRLEVQNRGAVARAFECALHTYFAVANAQTVTIAGLHGKTYLDKTENYARAIQNGDVKLAGETDRVYLDASGPVQIHDGARTIHIVGQEGWRSTVVWNPGAERAATMNDLSDWRGFVCVECGAVADDRVRLAAGEAYALDVAVSVQP